MKYDSIIKTCSCVVSSQLPFVTLSECTGKVNQSEREGCFLRNYQQKSCDSSHIIFKYHKNVTCSICDMTEVFGASLSVLCFIYDLAA